MITITLNISDIAKIMFMTLVFIGAIWYLAKIGAGACREAREEIRKLKGEIKRVWGWSSRPPR